ncbi:hypothetical protein RchiOBHm_Chr2g0103091 [Rosa chinensis]|uniref:SCP domain-containing protein n=2 Tax=Rosa chinensis TaxID=74649 RepID=A0A2P6RMU6_ROSCH|nr:hypothetical protein RchiOBHm_Chr2g0103091 [Rosa chinensis]
MMKKMARALVVVLAVTVAICLTQCHGYGLPVRPHYINFYGSGPRLIPRTNLSLDFLESQNKARAAVGVAPLKWSPSLEKAAHDVAWSMIYNEKGCHSYLDPMSLNRTFDIGGYNQHWDRYGTLPPGEVVDKWLLMKKYYNYANNSCSVRNNRCGWYTQVVWRNSLELGCAQERCFENRQSNGMTICLYSPRGNVPGQRPY